MTNADRAREYLAALTRGDTGEALRPFFTPDFVQIEYPNALNPKGQVSDLAGALERSEKGKAILRRQNFEIRNIVADGDHVALEVHWTGIPAFAVGRLAAGSEMHASFGVFLEFREGRIAKQRNYDCIEPL
jgi:ketosteroid isomerase-like protein